MSLRRSAPLLGRLLALALLVAVVPACKKKTDPHPVLTKVIPVWLANPTPHFPLIVLEFSKPMLESTVIDTNNITIESSSTATPFGGGWSLIYYPESFQVLVVPSAPLATAAPGPQWDIIVYPEVMSASGFGMQVPASGGVAARFTVGGTAIHKPSFPTYSAAPGVAPGTLDFSWVQAQENSVNISANYDIYMSTVDGEIDLARGFDLTRTDNTGFTMGTGGAAGAPLTSGVTYYFIIVVRGTEGNTTVTSQFSATAP